MLRDAGFEVNLFTDVDSKDSAFAHKSGFSLSRSGWRFSDFKAICRTFRRLLVHLPKSIRLFRLNRKDGFSMWENIRSLLISAHILGSGADWLYFGFATTGLQRENLARAVGAKMAVSIRGYDVATYPLKHPGCYKLLWERMDKLHYISNDLYAIALQTGLQESKPAIKITPAINTALFRSEVPKQFFINDSIQMVTVARLTWKKGLIYTLEALSRLKENGVKFHYTIVGGGSEKERIIYAINEMGLESWVHVKGKLPQDEIVNLLQNSDIYIQNSVQEGFCNAVLEAQAIGCICVVSDAGGLPENVLDQKTGYVVPKRKPELLALQLSDILRTDPGKLREMSENAVQRVREEFNLEKQKAAFIQFYTE